MPSHASSWMQQQTLSMMDTGCIVMNSYAGTLNGSSRPRELIDCDPAADHSLWHLSSQVGMSVFLFARLFRELVGMSPHRYLVHRRLCCARDLLRSGMAVIDVCYASGFTI